MAKHYNLTSEFGSLAYAQISTEETFSARFFTGQLMGDLFPVTRINIKAGLQPPDYMAVGSLEIVSGDLRRFLEQHEVNAEFLEVEVVQNDIALRSSYYFMNLLDIIKCLDRSRSIFSEFSASEGGGIFRIKELYLEEEAICNRKLFVLAEKPIVLVDSDMVNALQEAKFSGLKFHGLPQGPF